MSAITLKAPNGRDIDLHTGLFINGRFVESSHGGTLTSFDPVTEKEIAIVSSATAEDVNVAVSAARKALQNPSWRDIDPSERGAILLRLADLLEHEKENLATIEAWDTGKPYQVAFQEDITEVITVFRYYGGWADKLFGQTIPVHNKKFAYTLRQPVGVCGQIIPWNFPLTMLAWKLGPALACGNTVVLKPAEQTPLSALYFARLTAEAGLPNGVVNIVNGPGKVTGQAIVVHPDIDKIAFTGSTATGREVAKKAATVNMKNITLETGGKSALLVFEDANLEQAAKWAHVGIMSHQGQVCSATSRVLVQESVFEDFVKRLVDITKRTSVIGDPFDERTFQGPQVNGVQLERVLSYIESGKSEGATVVYGGKVPNITISRNGDNNLGKGFFIEPTIFTDVHSSMRIYKEEIFGPVVAVVKFKNEEEALELANDSVYGLGAAVFTTNIEKAHIVAQRLDAGMVWVNSSNDSDPRVPFGGVKQSGIGRECGEEGLRAYSQVKAVHVNLDRDY